VAPGEPIAGGPDRALARWRGAAVVLAEPAATPTPTLTPDPTNVSQLAQYLDAAWNAQDWVQVLQLIAAIKAVAPSYPDIDNKLYYAHVNYGYQLLTALQCTESLAEFRAAELLRPQGEEVLMGLELVTRYCGTQTAVVTATPIYTPALTGTPGATAIPGATATPIPITLTEPIQYTVLPGDTLYSLAKRYNTTVQQIMQANGLMSYFIRAGEVIWIPASGAASPGATVHIVQPGETLYSIAQDYSTTVWAIMSANGLRSTRIWAYRALFIPSVTAPGPIIHIVQPGETLFTISQRYDTTVALIMKANNLHDYVIHVYQQLVIPPAGWAGWPALIPGLPPAGGGVQYYVVKPGDTLYSIARHFGVTVAAIKAANGFTSNFILAGSTLRIP
jgi:LysM repeat protein